MGIVSLTSYYKGRHASLVGLLCTHGNTQHDAQFFVLVDGEWHKDAVCANPDHQIRAVNEGENQ